jgi:hypothetical protein
MRKIFLLIAAVSFVACAKKENAASDSSAAAAAAAPPAPAAITEADLRGTFTGMSMAEGSDSVIARWTCTNEGTGTDKCVDAAAPKDTITYTHTIDADSVMWTSAPYKPPQPPKSPQVIDKVVGRMSGGKWVGTFVTTLVSKPDSVVMRGRWEATKTS